jgi:hypothetical protein
MFRFRIYFLKLMNPFGQSIGLLGGGIGPTQGLYLHRTTQHRKTRTHIHASSGIRTHNPSFRAVEDRPLETALPLSFIFLRFLSLSLIKIIKRIKQICNSENLQVSSSLLSRVFFVKQREIVSHVFYINTVGSTDGLRILEHRVTSTCQFS